MENYGKKQEKVKGNDLKIRDEFGSRLRIGKVLAPHRACSIKSNVVY